LFGEDQGRYIIEIEKDNYNKVKEILDKSSVHYEELGIITEKDIIIDDKSKVTMKELLVSNNNWLKNYMGKQ
jgi:phosphoribosylformylglycinamidine synthase